MIANEECPYRYKQRRNKKKKKRKTKKPSHEIKQKEEIVLAKGITVAMRNSVDPILIIVENCSV